jgi:hypothetical protein
MLARKMPIIATVPACAGTTALIAVPPCEAPQAILNDKLLVGYAARRMFLQDRPMNADSAVFQRESGDEPGWRDVPDVTRDIGDPTPKITEQLGEDGFGQRQELLVPRIVLGNTKAKPGWRGRFNVRESVRRFEMPHDGCCVIRITPQTSAALSPMRQMARVASVTRCPCR